MIIHNKYGEKLDYSLHEASKEGVLVVIGHGVTGDKDRPLVQALSAGLADRGWPCLRFSFAGNGESDGKFEEATIPKEVDDLHSVLDQVKGANKIVYIGHSMGGAVGALAAAKDDRIDVLVSLAGMVRTKVFCDTEFGEETPGDGCMWEDEACPLSVDYVESMAQIDNTLTAAREIKTPWLLLHGDADDVVLPQDSEDLYNTLRGKKKHVVVPGGEHCFDDHYDVLVEEIDTWLTEHVKLPN